MQITTTMSYYFTPARMAITNKTREISAGEDVEKKRTVMHCWWEYKQVKPLWETVRSFLRKLTTELPYNPAISLLGI